jgi:porin
LDQDRILFTGSAGIIRNYEFVLELSYWAQFAPWWVLQPDMQLVFHPGGRVAAPPPALETQPIPNALVLGVRSTITF